MAYKWKPSKAAKRAFAEKMQDPAEAAAYEARKAERANKRRAGSNFNYQSAGESYVPTKEQHDFCLQFISQIIDCTNATLTEEQRRAIDTVVYGYSCNEKVHHDHIHVVNELRRANPNI